MEYYNGYCIIVILINEKAGQREWLWIWQILTPYDKQLVKRGDSFHESINKAIRSGKRTIDKGV